jgi:hypothetical protein
MTGMARSLGGNALECTGLVLWPASPGKVGAKKNRRREPAVSGVAEE